ncbi:MAG: protein-disulfide reductase DsbD domain-containing protein [Pyrinomonadaceae bacterium]
MNKKIFLGLIFSSALFFAVGSASAQTASGSIAGGKIKRGRTARATVVLNIPGGLHVNSYRPNSDNLIATRVYASGVNAKIGPVSYPRGVNKKFAFQDDSDKPLNVYEGRAVFNFNVTVPANYKGNTVSVRTTVKFQACNDEVCFAPKKQEFVLTASVN